MTVSCCRFASSRPYFVYFRREATNSGCRITVKSSVWTVQPGKTAAIFLSAATWTDTSPSILAHCITDLSARCRWPTNLPGFTTALIRCWLVSYIAVYIQQRNAESKHVLASTWCPLCQSSVANNRLYSAHLTSSLL